MRAIRALPDRCCAACKQRDYNFQLSSNEETTRWATNLVASRRRGLHVPGFMVMPPPDDDLETDGVRTKPVAAEESEQFQ